MNELGSNAASIEDNLRIRNGFLELTATQKKLLIEQLPNDEKIALVKIFQEDGNVPLSLSTIEHLEQHLRSVVDITPIITQKAKLSPLEATFTTKITDQINYSVFNVMTASLADQLIRKAIQQREIKDDLPHISAKKLKTSLYTARGHAIEEEPINLAKLLQFNGFSTEIINQYFTDNISLKGLNLEGITFDTCTFGWTLFNNSRLKNVIFQHCDISNISFIHSELENCQFNDCELREVFFTAAKLENTLFFRTGMISCSFEDASLTRCQFITVSMPATHFLETSIHDCIISNSNLRDTVFFGNLDQFSSVDDRSKSTAEITKPLTAILINPEVRGLTVPMAYEKLDQAANTIPLRITMQPAKTKAEDVDREVEAALLAVGPYHPSLPPIPQRLIQYIKDSPDANPYCSSILRKAEKLSSEIDAIFLPGGEDLSPALYGQEKEELTDWKGDYRRSMLELGLIHQAHNKGIPVMAVCRGFQMTNVYFGAQLIQHVEGQKGIQEIKLDTPEKVGLYACAKKSCILSVAFHHQAVSLENPASEYLETAAVYEGLVKLVEPKHAAAAPMILIQLHPEWAEEYKPPAPLPAGTSSSSGAADPELAARGVPNIFIGDESPDTEAKSAAVEREEKALFEHEKIRVTMSKDNKAFWDILSSSASAYRTKQATLKQIRELRGTSEA